MSSKSPLTRGKRQKALALLQRRRLPEAKTLLEQVCGADRRDTEAWYLLAAINQELGLLDQAVTCYRQVIALQPDHADAHYYLGNALRARQQHDKSAEHYQRALALRPEHVEASCNLGWHYEQQGEFSRALECYEHALRYAPYRPELHYNTGRILRQLGQLEAAERQYRSAIELQPGFAEAHNNLANLLQERGQATEAATCYRRAVALKPDYVEALYNLALALRDRGQFDEAIAGYQRAIALRPDHVDAHFGLAVLWLLTGRYQPGWDEYEWRWQRPASPSRPLPRSAGSSAELGGKNVFLHTEQGLGDELFFLRFVPWLKSCGTGTVAYRANPKIASLLGRAPVLDHVVGPEAMPAPADLVFAVGDLPRLLGMERADQIPPPLALAPLPAAVEAVRAKLAALGPPPYVGVTWRAGTKDNLDRLYKESPLRRLATLLGDRPATVLILQRHPLPGEVEAFRAALGHPAHDLSILNDDLEQMLALLSLIDDYVGVSNTNMHLRAGVGRTAKVLVPAPPEWRWMAEGRESPWFPGFRVYRQEYDGSWEQAFAELAGDMIHADA